MTFGYLGYIWALLACGTFSLVLFGSASLLYAFARRGRSDRTAPSGVVESIPLRGRDAKDPTRGPRGPERSR